MGVVVGLPVFIVSSWVHALPLLAVVALVHLLTLSLFLVQFSPVAFVEVEVDAHGADAVALVAPVGPYLHLLDGGVLLDDHHGLLYRHGVLGHRLVSRVLAMLSLDDDLLGCVLTLRLLLHLVDRFLVLRLPDPLGLVLRLESGPGVVHQAIQAVRGKSFDELAETVKKTAFRVTRMGQLVAQEASRRLGVPFGIVDLSLAPTPAVGDSVARILEEMGLEICGTHGTTAALALLNDAVKKGGVMASSSVGGLSGAFIPVSEDEGMIAAAREGTLCLDKLEAMTCVCSVGLDMIAVPGDTPAETIAAIIADEAAIGMVNNKTTAVRLLPAPGKSVGDTVEMGGLLGSAPVMPVHAASSAAFIARGGRIPAPLHSLKN